MKIQHALLILALTAAFDAQAGAVIVGKNSSFASMDIDMARRIFLGREFSLNGQNIALVYQGEGPTRTDFETKVLGKTGSDLTAYWSKLIFTGKATPPLEAGGDDGVKALVGRVNGSIGYISDGAVDDSVKVLYKF